ECAVVVVDRVAKNAIAGGRSGVAENVNAVAVVMSDNIFFAGAGSADGIIVISQPVAEKVNAVAFISERRYAVSRDPYKVSMDDILKAVDAESGSAVTGNNVS